MEEINLQPLKKIHVLVCALVTVYKYLYSCIETFALLKIKFTK